MIHPLGIISEIKLKRTDTILDRSQSEDAVVYVETGGVVELLVGVENVYRQRELKRKRREWGRGGIYMGKRTFKIALGIRAKPIRRGCCLEVGMIWMDMG